MTITEDMLKAWMDKGVPRRAWGKMFGLGWRSVQVLERKGLLPRKPRTRGKGFKINPERRNSPQWCEDCNVLITPGVNGKNATYSPWCNACGDVRKKAEEKPRTCLNCYRKFRSMHAGNRLCRECGGVGWYDRNPQLEARNDEAQRYD